MIKLFRELLIIVKIYKELGKYMSLNLKRLEQGIKIADLYKEHCDEVFIMPYSKCAINQVREEIIKLKTEITEKQVAADD